VRRWAAIKEAVQKCKRRFGGQAQAQGMGRRGHARWVRTSRQEKAAAAVHFMAFKMACKNPLSKHLPQELSLYAIQPASQLSSSTTGPAHPPASSPRRSSPLPACLPTCTGFCLHPAPWPWPAPPWCSSGTHYSGRRSALSRGRGRGGGRGWPLLRGGTGRGGAGPVLRQAA